MKQNKKIKNLMIRTNDVEKLKIEENAKRLGFHSVSEFLRYLGVNAKDVKVIY